MSFPDSWRAQLPNLPPSSPLWTNGETEAWRSESACARHPVGHAADGRDSRSRVLAEPRRLLRMGHGLYTSPRGRSGIRLSAGTADYSPAGPRADPLRYHHHTSCENGSRRVCAHSRNVNPYTHRDTHPHAQRRKRTDRACKPAKSRQPMHARSHANQTHPASAHSGTRRAIHSIFMHQLRLSATLIAKQSHAHHARALGASPQSLGPSTIPPGKRTRAPNSPFPSCSPRDPQTPQFTVPGTTSLGCRPGALLLPGPRAAPPLTSPPLTSQRLLQLARGAHGSARLHWRGSPRSRNGQRGGIPGWGRGLSLPDSLSSH